MVAVRGEAILGRLAIGDPVFCRAIMAGNLPDGVPPLDVRTVALLRLGRALGAGAAPALWHQCAEEALDAGLTLDEIVGCLLVLAPGMGIERTAGAAAELAEALGCPIDAGQEEHDLPWAVGSRPAQMGSLFVPLSPPTDPPSGRHHR